MASYLSGLPFLLQSSRSRLQNRLPLSQVSWFFLPRFTATPASFSKVYTTFSHLLALLRVRRPSDAACRRRLYLPQLTFTVVFQAAISAATVSGRLLRPKPLFALLTRLDAALIKDCAHRLSPLLRFRPGRNALPAERVEYASAYKLPLPPSEDRFHDCF